MSRRPKRKHNTPTREAGDRGQQAGLPSSRGRVLRFALIFIVLVVLGSASEIYILRQQTFGQSFSGDAVYAFQKWVARTVGWCLQATSVSVRVDDTTISIGGRQIEVAVECTGIKPTAVFWAGVLAFPCAWRSRAIGLLTGLIGVGVLNVLRIVALGLAAGYNYSWFDPLHAVLMQGFVVVFVAPLWIIWMLRTIRVPTPLPQAAD